MTSSATPLLCIPEIASTNAVSPHLIMAVGSANASKPSSAEIVLAEIRRLLDDSGFENPPACRVVRQEAEVRALYEGGFTPQRTVVLYDGAVGKSYFRHTMSARGDELPGISGGAMWGIAIGERAAFNSQRAQGCAEQVVADFVKNFDANLERVGVQGGQSQDIHRQWYPWGPAKRGEVPHTQLIAMPDMDELMERLQAGPDMRDGLSLRHDRQLPAGSRLSYLRVSPTPFVGDTAGFTQVAVTAFDAFEQAARTLIERRPDMAQALLAGVDINPRLIDAYLRPLARQFSVRRLDLHHGNTGEYASESDEMPGGLVHAYHQDASYGINAASWKQTWDALTADGLLVFLVSNDWSAGYIKETEWLVRDLCSKGYPTMMLTSDQAGQLRVRPDGVYFEDAKVGTINRMFPIFEAEGAVADIVLAAQDGLVRLTPEFAFYGNKTLFALFRRYEAEFARLLEPAVFDTLQNVIPDSHLVVPAIGGEVTGFPFTVNLEDGRPTTVAHLGELKALSSTVRSKVVLKVAGANLLAARMYGVFMGDQTQDAWIGWIDDRIAKLEPFIVQERRTSQVVAIPVLNHGNNQSAVFQCRVLIRPWAILGKLVSATITAVPKETERVHGMVDMAQAPVKFV